MKHFLNDSYWLATSYESFKLKLSNELIEEEYFICNANIWGFEFLDQEVYLLTKGNYFFVIYVFHELNKGVVIGESFKMLQYNSKFLRI